MKAALLAIACAWPAYAGSVWPRQKFGADPLPAWSDLVWNSPRLEFALWTAKRLIATPTSLGQVRRVVCAVPAVQFAVW